MTPLLRPFHHSNGCFSASKSWAAIFNAVVLVKYALSGMTLGGTVFGPFDAAAAAALVAAFNAAYVAREYQVQKLEPKGAEK